MTTPSENSGKVSYSDAEAFGGVYLIRIIGFSSYFSALQGGVRLNA